MKPAARFYSSPLSRFCAEELPADFHFLDGDEVLLRYSSQPIHYACETRILRIFESKAIGEPVRRSQLDVFPLLADAISLAISHGIVGRGSGVFVIEGEPPYAEGAEVRQVLPGQISRAAGLQFLGPQQMAAAELRAFIRCRGQLKTRSA